MKSFSDFKITVAKRFVGDKIKINRVLNIPVVVHNYKIDESKYKKNKSGKCLTLQIDYDNEQRILFTGSDILIEQIGQVNDDDMPFQTTIVKNGEGFEFR